MSATQIILIGLLALLATVHCSTVHKLNVGVLFTTQINHTMFNWTSNVATDKFSFRPSLSGYPDLPSFLRYKYSDERRVGYLYGTPSEGFANQLVEIQIVALNKQSYETRQQKLVLKIERKNSKSNRNILQMKIDNLNWVNLMDPGRIEDLKNIFRNELWPESRQDLNVVFLDGAVNMGGRLPASPQLKEGVVVQLGSKVDFSPRLKDLHEEVKPLYKMASCNFKRTSVQSIFEHEGFKLDWCAFKLIELGSASQNSEANKLKGEFPRDETEWKGLKYEDIPVRNYIDELAFTIAVPGMILAVLVAFLSGILCFHHESVPDEDLDGFIKSLFDICKEFRSPRNVPTVVQVSDATATATTTTTLKSLRDAPAMLPDDVSSMISNSPNFSRSEEVEVTPHLSSTYLRPKPPPYKSTTGQSPYASHSSTGHLRQQSSSTSNGQDM